MADRAELIVTGAGEVAAMFRRAASTIEPRLAKDLKGITRRISTDYRKGVGRYSTRTARGVGFEVSVTARGVEGSVFNTHVNAEAHEFGGARSAPNPAMQEAVAEHAPSWVEQVARRAGDVG